MSKDPHDVVKVASGSFVAIEMYQQGLKEASIESKVVGLNLEASFGTAIPGSIELWVHRSDLEKAAAAIKMIEEQRGKQHHEHQSHPHPESEHKPQPPRRPPEPYVNPNPGS